MGPCGKARAGGDLIDGVRFRQVLGHYPTGVCIVTAMEKNGVAAGMVVGSFTSVSLEPPLVAILPGRRSTTWPRLAAVGKFCVNVLACDQLSLCKQFATGGDHKFAGVSHCLSSNGSPILDGVVAWIQCDLHAVYEAGDHVIALGHVTELEVQKPDEPLLFFRGGYGTFVSREVAEQPT
jgi:3-hydroxy-9,10-secoandrosta-1,3,5(10)-triene-9,17-dione monooxygenase reductase component